MKSLQTQLDATKIPPKRFIPFGSLVALYVYPAKVSDNGLVMPDGTQHPNQSPTAHVIAVGPECKQLKEGDTVICTGQSLTAWAFCEGDKYLMTREDSIMGVLLYPENSLEDNSGGEVVKGSAMDLSSIKSNDPLDTMEKVY